MSTMLIHTQLIKTSLEKQQIDFQTILKAKQIILADKLSEMLAWNVLFVDFDKKKQITRKEWLKQNK